MVPADPGFVDVTLTPKQDTLKEGPETVVVTISSVGGVAYPTGAPNSAPVTIVDGD